MKRVISFFAAAILMGVSCAPELDFPSTPDLSSCRLVYVFEGDLVNDFNNFIFVTLNDSKETLEKKLGFPIDSSVFTDTYKPNDVTYIITYFDFNKENVESIEVICDRFRTSAADLYYMATKADMVMRYGCNPPFEIGLLAQYPQFGVGFYFDVDLKYITSTVIFKMDTNSIYKLPHRIESVKLVDTSLVDKDNDSYYSKFEMEWGVTLGIDSGWINQWVGYRDNDTSAYTEITSFSDYLYWIVPPKTPHFYIGGDNFTGQFTMEVKVIIKTIANFEVCDTVFTVQLESDSLDNSLPYDKPLHSANILYFLRSNTISADFLRYESD